MPTFRRLLGFLRPYRSGVIWSFALALGALGGTVAIPYLTGRAINSIGAHNHHQLTILAIAIVIAGLLRLILSVFRRLIAGRVSLGVEVDMRNRLYGRLQQLELSFFDRQQTGQLMSRATVDLQSVRFFLGYGLIFIAQSLLTILLAGVAMFALQPGLAAISLAPVPFVAALAAEQAGRPARAGTEVGGHGAGGSCPKELCWCIGVASPQSPEPAARSPAPVAAGPGTCRRCRPRRSPAGPPDICRRAPADGGSRRSRSPPGCPL